MKNEPVETLIADLDALLDQERAALLQGDLLAISALSEPKEALINRLNSHAAPPARALPQLQGKVLRNQELLDGALEGIRAVADRMAQVRKIRRNLETYDQSGRKTAVLGLVEHKMEKRA